MEPSSAVNALVHHLVLSGIAARGHAPTVSELAAAAGVPAARVEESFLRLSEGHGLVLQPGSTEVWIAHPFSLSPTATWVAASDGRGWWAPCLWCATGIAALVDPRAAIHTRVAGEVEPLIIELGDVAPSDPLLVHFALPPHRAWDNVVHHCAMVLPFRAERDIDAWCERHRLPRGEAVPIARVAALGRLWYGRHLDRDWHKWTGAEAEQIFERVGLTGEHWRVASPGASPDQRF